MALTPKICVTVKNNCSGFSISDITEEYNSKTNIGGWGSPNITTSDIVEAVIRIDDGYESHEYDVIDSIPSTVTGEYELTLIEDTFVDGEYTVTYLITDDNGLEYSCTKKVYITCNVRCCVDKMWLSYISELGGSDCGCGCSGKITLNDILFAEALYKSLTRAAGCLNNATRDKILSQLQKICQYSNCNC